MHQYVFYFVYFLGYITSRFNFGGHFVWSNIIMNTFVWFYGSENIIGEWKVTGHDSWYKTKKTPDHFFQQLQLNYHPGTYLLR